jgi:SOS-response transcriptional repressor LexA/DNA-binding Xre family transcriptional regulator
MITYSDLYMGVIQERIAAIVTARSKLGELSQRELAKALGCSQTTVSYLLNGQRGLSEKWIEKFCRILNVTLSDLDKPEPPPRQPKPLREMGDKLKQLYESKSLALKYLDGLADLFLDLERRSIRTMRYDKLLDAVLRLCRDTLPSETLARKNSNVVTRNFGAQSERIAEPSETGGQEIRYTDSDAPRPIEKVRVPYYDAIPAGDPREMSAENNVWMEIVHSKAKETWFTLRVTGDSMSPDYLDGDIVLMDHASKPNNGDIVAALIDGSESTLKVFSRTGDEITLTPIEREHHSPRIFHASGVAVQGVLVEIVRRTVVRKR